MCKRLERQVPQHGKQNHDNHDPTNSSSSFGTGKCRRPGWAAAQSTPKPSCWTGNQRDHQQCVKTKGGSHLAMQQGIQRPLRPTTRTMQAGQSMKLAARIKAILTRVESMQHPQCGSTETDRRHQQPPLLPSGLRMLGWIRHSHVDFLTGTPAGRFAHSHFRSRPLADGPNCP